MEFPIDSEEARVWIMFLRAHAMLMREMESNLIRETGMSLAWLDVLVQLSLEEGHRMTHTRLSQRTLVSRGITRLVDRMVKAGLVVRHRSRRDRRTSYVVMTPKGAEALDRMYPIQYLDVTDMFMRHLDSESTPVVKAFLARVLGEDGAQ